MFFCSAVNTPGESDFHTNYMRKDMYIYNQNDGEASACDTYGHLDINPARYLSTMVIEEYDTIHQCEICGKKFSDTYNLKIHTCTHTSKNPYACDVCNVTFADKK